MGTAPTLKKESQVVQRIIISGAGERISSALETERAAE